MSSSEARQAALEAVRTASRDAQAAGELPLFLGALEQIRIEILISLSGPSDSRSADPKEDRLLSVAEVADRVGQSKWWVYQHKDSLPIVRFSTGRYAFSEKGLERWIQRRIRP